MKWKNGLRLAEILLLTVIMIFSAVKLVQIKVEYDTGEAIYEAAVNEFIAHPEAMTPLEDSFEENQDGTESAAVPEQEPDAVDVNEEDYPDLGIDFEKLRQVNPDIIGWIWIPDTRINFPLVQGEDNDMYLHTAYNLESSRFGSIFMDYRNNADFTDANTIIYGHSMRTDAMFGTLSDFENPEFAGAHTDLYIYTPEATFYYKIFSAYTAKTDEFPYVIRFTQETSHESFLQFIVEESVSLKREEPLTVHDRILTLSTCLSTSSYQKRFVVHGVLMSGSLD